jgi:hypothetical protein
MPQRFEIYTGKKDDTVERKLGERVVKSLVEDIQNKDHKLYFDNYFTSSDLLRDLKNKKIHACGTVNPTRKNLPVLKSDKNMKRGLNRLLKTWFLKINLALKRNLNRCTADLWLFCLMSLPTTGLEGPEKSAVPEYCVDLGHGIQFHDTSIYATQTRYMDRTVRTTEIELNPNNM